MNTFKTEVNKVIFALTSVGLVLLMLPASLSATHFRYGTMFWEEPWDNRTIRLNMEIGWTVPHSYGGTPTTVGGINTASNSKIKIFWGDGTSDFVTYKVTAIDENTDDAVSEMGDNSTGEWIAGALHTYPDNGTEEYVVYWGSGLRLTSHNMGAGTWSHKTKINIGGTYSSNVSPVSKVPPVVQVQDNTSDFKYQLLATDANDDSLGYRWGTKAEFYSAVDNATGAWTVASGSYYKPFGMTLSTSGLVTWDVRDSVIDNGTVNSLWVAVMMVEDLDSSSGDNKSYIPIDFFFKLSNPANPAPSFTAFPPNSTVSLGSKKIFTIKSIDNSGVAPILTIMSAPPSDNQSIWDNATSTSGTSPDITTLTIEFEPDSTMGNTTKAVAIRSTDSAGMTKDQSFSIFISTVANADPTAPTQQSPANGSTVTEPVTFKYAASTDSDGDTVSYTLYICDDPGFVGSGLCSGSSITTAGVNFVPPFNQNFHDNLIPWPSPLHAATISKQISQDLSMIPKLFIMLGVLGLLSVVIISLSVKNIKHRRIVFMLFLIIIGTTLSCMKSSDNSASSSDNSTSISDTTVPTVSSVSTTSDNQSSASITDNIIVTFSEAMDPTYVTTGTSDTNCAGTIRVSSDNFSTCIKMSSSPSSSNSNKTFTLEPVEDIGTAIGIAGDVDDYLTVSTTYLTRVTTGVKDTAGNAMSSQYETSSGFTTDNGSSFSSSDNLTFTSLTSGTTYYWKVIASDPKGGSAQTAETWSFTVQ
jgi:hypothetical protein